MKLTFDEAKHEYTLNGQRVPGVTRILEDCGFYPAYPDNGCKERGHAVHLCCELFDKGQLLVGEGGGYPGTDRRLWGYIDGWRKFRRDMGQWRWEAIEEAVAHTGLRVAGKLDRAGCDLVTGLNLILDIKSGDPVAEAAALQTAGYGLLKGYNRETTQRFTVDLTAQGDYHLIEYKNSADWDNFVIVTKYWWLRNQRKFMQNGRQK